MNLQWLDLRSNSIAKVDEIDQLCEVWSQKIKTTEQMMIRVKQLTELKSLYFRGADGDGANPGERWHDDQCHELRLDMFGHPPPSQVCSHPAYVSITMSRLPALEILDGWLFCPYSFYSPMNHSAHLQGGMCPS